jgi:protein-disulfide isomerase
MNETARLSPPVSERDHAEGSEDAPLTLVEFGDYQCPYCGEAHPVVKRLQRHFGKRLRFIFRNFPLTQAHPYALVAAEAAEAAALQGKFWQMHNFIYEHQEGLEPDVLPGWAQQVGLDLEAFGRAIKQEKMSERIKEDRTSGIRSGVNGTPCFFINGSRYDGDADYESLKATLDEQLVNQNL